MNSSSKSLKFIYDDGNSKEQSHVCAIGRLPNPDKPLKITVICPALHTQLPVTKRMKRRKLKICMFPTIRSKYLQTRDSCFEGHSGKLNNDVTFFGVSVSCSYIFCSYICLGFSIPKLAVTVRNSRVDQCNASSRLSYEFISCSLLNDNHQA